MHHITDIIKYEGDNATIIWKHPCEDFNTASQLIVHENQEAVFFLDGQALDLFGPGRHTLETQNIPLLRNFTNLPSGGVSPFHCEVYFINKSERMAIKWGTDTRVQYVDPRYGFPLSIGASGDMSLRVEDSRRLLIKLVGTETAFTQSHLSSYFRSILMNRIKPYIAGVIKEQGISIFEIDQHLTAFSEAIKALLQPDFSPYGICLEQFFVTTVVRPEGDRQYETFRELHFRQYADIAEARLRQQVDIIDAETEAKKTAIEAEALAKKRATEGYTYGQERGFDVAEKVAENEATGEFTSMGVGLGMMAGVGGTVGGMVGGVLSDTAASVNTPSRTTAFCDQCGAPLAANARFCEQCGAKIAASVCRGCGYRFERNGNFCPQCGTKREG